MICGMELADTVSEPARHSYRNNEPAQFDSARSLIQRADLLLNTRIVVVENEPIWLGSADVHLYLEVLYLLPV